MSTRVLRSQGRVPEINDITTDKQKFRKPIKKHTFDRDEMVKFRNFTRIIPDEIIVLILFFLPLDKLVLVLTKKFEKPEIIEPIWAIKLNNMNHEEHVNLFNKCVTDAKYSDLMEELLKMGDNNYFIKQVFCNEIYFKERTFVDDYFSRKCRDPKILKCLIDRDFRFNKDNITGILKEYPEALPKIYKTYKIYGNKYISDIILILYKQKKLYLLIDANIKINSEISRIIFKICENEEYLRIVKDLQQKVEQKVEQKYKIPLSILFVNNWKIIDNLDYMLELIDLYDINGDLMKILLGINKSKNQEIVNFKKDRLKIISYGDLKSLFIFLAERLQKFKTKKVTNIIKQTSHCDKKSDLLCWGSYVFSDDNFDFYCELINLWKEHITKDLMVNALVLSRQDFVGFLITNNYLDIPDNYENIVSIYDEPMREYCRNVKSITC